MYPQRQQLQATTCVQLDAPTRVYKPGGAITGRLHLPKAIQNLPMLALQGIVKSKTTYDNHGTRRGRTLVAWQNIPLQEIDAQLAADRSSGKTFRFTTTVPLNSTSVPIHVPVPEGKGSDYWDYPGSWKGDQHFCGQDSGSSSLPPTCKFGPRGVKTISECQIEYAIVAFELPSDSSDARLNKTVSSKYSPKPLASAGFWLVSLPGPLPKAAPRDDVWMGDKRLLFSTEKLVPEGRLKLTTWQRIKAGLASASIPQAAFSVKLVRPHTIRAGSPFEVWMELNPIDTDAVRIARASGKRKIPNAVLVHMPDVKLKSAKIDIEHMTTVRTRGHICDREDSWEEFILTLSEPPSPKAARAVDENQDKAVMQWAAADFCACHPADAPLPSWVKDNTSFTRSPAVNISLNRKLTFQTVVPDRLVPTFKSYNITRRYRWRLNLAFECAGQLQQIHYRFPGITILPPEIGDDREADGALDWGEYKLKPEKELLHQRVAGFGLDVTKLAFNIAMQVI